MLALLFLTSLVLTASADEEFRPKVLVYSIQSGFSHVNFMGRVADTLAEGGMDVTLLLNELRTEVGSGTTKARVFAIEASKEAFDYITDPSNDESKSIYEGSSHDLRSMLNFAPLFNKIFYLSCKNLLSKPEVIEQLRAEKYDVMLAETFDYCGFGIAKLLGIKSTVAVFSSSLNDYTAWITGTPSPWSVVQSAYSGVVDRSISSRLWNLLCVAADFRVNHLFVSSAIQAFEERFGPNFPSIQELIANCSLIVTAGDPLLDLPRPTQRKIVDIGAIGIREAKPLEKEYDDLLNLRPRTVVFSLGSVAQTSDMPIEFKRGLAQAFSRFPDVTFLWKYEKPEDAGSFLQGVGNVVLRKWMPQNDLLGDSRVVALITHGGKTSLNEVGAKGLPTVFIPIYGDQPRNAAIAVKLGFGIFLNKRDLGKPDVIESAIKEVLYNEKYSKSAKLVAEMIHSRPFSVKELLVKNVKFAAQFGNVKSLDQEGFDYPLYIYWNLDLLLVLLLIVFFPVVLIYLCCSRYICVKRKTNKLKKN
ncbi:hypothetical protein PENTCL1PPCAC_17061 [Pristionchus entomophagus]|uniref:glucuronosyltransferase n=1 Tax=Pristionchus entomophagus TaxID=358040 RepID=A0AAV5TKQ2_9BILA|nr:hypothetical protein PENTCL1PPCAC_17061 [Pristionchus entomophagus]